MQQEIYGFTLTATNSTSSFRSKLRRMERRQKYREQEAKYLAGKMTKGDAELFELTRKVTRKPPPVMVTIFQADATKVFIPAHVYATSPKFAKHFKASSQPFRM